MKDRLRRDIEEARLVRKKEMATLEARRQHENAIEQGRLHDIFIAEMRTQEKDDKMEEAKTRQNEIIEQTKKRIMDHLKHVQENKKRAEDNFNQKQGALEADLLVKSLKSAMIAGQTEKRKARGASVNLNKSNSLSEDTFLGKNLGWDNSEDKLKDIKRHKEELQKKEKYCSILVCA